MQYIKLKKLAEEVDLFSDDEVEEGTQPISHEDYERLIQYLEKKNPPAILPIQIAYYAGLRIGETCGLTWQDINLEEQCLTIKRSIRYDGMKHKNIIGPTKRKKVRIVDFGDTLTEILKAARKEQLKNRMQYGKLYHRNYYKEMHVKNRVCYEYYHLDGTQDLMIIDIVGTWCIGIPLCLLAAYVFKWGIIGVYTLLTTEELFRLAVSLIIFRRRKWIISLC